jgi:methane/ammonia monooxygenase subunit C
VSAGFAGLAGGLYAYSEQYISPNTYVFELTVLFLLAIIMGGRKTRTGAILGAAIIVMLPFYVQMTVIPLVGAVALAVLWFTRDRNVMSITPQEELKRYYYVLTLLAVASILAAVIFGLFVEADAAWHQTTVRDTDFTPTHIALFYFAIPAALVGLTFAWMWVHTRLPEFTKRISVPLSLVVAGPILIMPNLGLNEWGHTFFYAEELFAAPIHWGFVVLAWGIYALGGFAVQCVARIAELTRLTSAKTT